MIRTLTIWSVAPAAMNSARARRLHTMMVMGAATRWEPLTFSRNTNTVFSLMTETNEVTAVRDFDDMILSLSSPALRLLWCHAPLLLVNVAHAHLNRPSSQQKDRWWCVVEILYAVADLIARANRAGIEPPESSRDV